MTDSPKPASDPAPFMARGRRLNIPTGLPRRHRAPDPLGGGAFSSLVMLPPDEGGPPLASTVTAHVILVGMGGVALLENGGHEALLSPGVALGLMAGQYTIGTVGLPGAVLAIAVMTPRAMDRLFDRGDLSQIYLNMAKESSFPVPPPDQIGGICPLPDSSMAVAPLLPHLPLHGLAGALARAMGALPPKGDFYSFLAAGPCAHRAGKPLTEVPEKFIPFVERNRRLPLIGCQPHSFWRAAALTRVD